MTDERRRSEAQSLRDLFASQWRFIIALFESGRQGRQIAAEDIYPEAVETMINGTDKRIRALGSYKKRLRQTITLILSYIDEAVACIPEAIPVNAGSFTAEPAINAFFVNMDDIRQVFSHSHSLQEFFSNYNNLSCDQAYAALFVAREEKHMLGSAIVNDVLVRDVKQVAVNFFDHEIISPACSEEEARKSLKEYMYNQIVEYVSAHMAQIRAEQVRFSDKTNPLACIGNLCNPEIYLDELVTQLSIPNMLLRCEKNRLRLNKMGIKVDEKTTEAVNEFIAHEVRIGDQPPRVVTLIRYPRKEMQDVELLF